MESKKKLIVALTSLCSVLLIAVVTMGIVWAATTQTINSNVKVTYTATAVSGSVSANYYFGSDTGTAMTSDGTNSGATTITFTDSQANVNGALQPQGNIVLQNADGQTFVIFEYIISNTSTTKGMSAVLTYTDNSTSPNVADTNIYAYTHSAGTTAVSTPWTNVATLRGASNANIIGGAATPTEAPNGQFISGTVAANTTAYFYVVVEIKNLANDAEFSGQFSWNLTVAS